MVVAQAELPSGRLSVFSFVRGPEQLSNGGDSESSTRSDESGPARLNTGQTALSFLLTLLRLMQPLLRHLLAMHWDGRSLRGGYDASCGFDRESGRGGSFGPALGALKGEDAGEGDLRECETSDVAQATRSTGRLILGGRIRRKRAT